MITGWWHDGTLAWAWCCSGNVLELLVLFVYFLCIVGTVCVLLVLFVYCLCTVGIVSVLLLVY